MTHILTIVNMLWGSGDNLINGSMAVLDVTNMRFFSLKSYVGVYSIHIAVADISSTPRRQVGPFATHQLPNWCSVNARLSEPTSPILIVE